MKPLTSVLATVLLVAAASGAAAQTVPTSAAGAGPRLELGGGAAWFLDAGAPSLADVRATVAVSRNWAVEGVLSFSPQSDGTYGIYRVHAKWRFLDGAGSAGVEAHLTFGGAGFFSHWSFPAYSWTDSRTGQNYNYGGDSGWSVDAPIYPTVGFGVQKRLGSHLAVRADLAVGFGINDYGIGYAIMPSVGFSIPVGRYAPGSGR
jgi:hypothetical protein